MYRYKMYFCSAVRKSDSPFFNSLVHRAFEHVGFEIQVSSYAQSKEQKRRKKNAAILHVHYENGMHRSICCATSTYSA